MLLGRGPGSCARADTSLESMSDAHAQDGSWGRAGPSGPCLSSCSIPSGSSIRYPPRRFTTELQYIPSLEAFRANAHEPTPSGLQQELHVGHRLPEGPAFPLPIRAGPPLTPHQVSAEFSVCWRLFLFFLLRSILGAVKCAGRPCSSRPVQGSARSPGTTDHPPESSFSARTGVPCTGQEAAVLSLCLEALFILLTKFSTLSVVVLRW